MKHKFPYEWRLKDGYPAKGIEPHRLKVFGTFICGGGSTMGYKLAGFNHIGGVEIDPKMAEAYKVNHNPKHLYVEDIRDFVKRDDLPEELYDLDILDGSPPCSSFSMAGNREKDWGKEKKFREGQAEQVLDDLFFEYIKLAKKLQPKVVIAENVKGLLLGNAKAYVRRIKAEFEEAGYNVQLFLLNAANMGVPQKRERVFFICLRNDLAERLLVQKDMFTQVAKLKLEFNEPDINFESIKSKDNGKELTGKARLLWENREITDTLLSDACYRMYKTKVYFSSMLQKDNKPLYTIIGSESSPIIHYDKPHVLSDLELKRGGTYPIDYNFIKLKPKYLIGMSVPPVMTAQIAHEIYLQWFKTEQEQNG